MEAEIPALQPTIFRTRRHFRETASTGEMAALIDTIGRRGTYGLLLKAPDAPEVAAAVDRLCGRGVPIITLVTDVANCGREAYVGMDNRAAGETAAFLIGEWLGPGPAKVLATLSSNRLREEEEREIDFRRALRTRYPYLGVVDVSEALGINRTTGALVRQALAAFPDIAAVYSIGGGNLAVLEAFDSMKRPCRVFVGHDLNADNRGLLQAARISAVLQHDLHSDMRLACQHVMRAHRLLPKAAPSPPHKCRSLRPSICLAWGPLRGSAHIHFSSYKRDVLLLTREARY